MLLSSTSVDICNVLQGDSWVAWDDSKVPVPASQRLLHTPSENTEGKEEITLK